MTIRDNTNQFEGRHWETGTVRNYFAATGVTAPHTGQPISEALLMGISGGAVMGYFSFAYEGYDPHARILTRNTFDPFNRILERLGVVQNIQHTASPEKAVKNLVNALEEGTPAIVWADMWSLPYNALSYDDGMWAMFPVLVYGYDEAAATVWIADRARVPLTVTTAELAIARARIKKDKHRLLTLDPPNPNKFAAAVQAGIWDCINLYTEKPPKGSKNNFGLLAFEHWAKLLTRPKTRLSWEKSFPAGSKMLAGLTSVYTDVVLFGKGAQGHADRDLYADFLDEASILLERPALKAAAAQFRVSAAAWERLAAALLPEDVFALHQTRSHLLRRHQVFLEQGNAALDEIASIDEWLGKLKAEITENFPLSPGEVVELREALAAQVLALRDIEAAAVGLLKTAMT